MLIGIDASRATTNRKTGTEHYCEQIIYHISKIDHKNDYILFSDKKPDKNSLLYTLPKNFSWKIIPGGYLWTQIKLSHEMMRWKNKLDVLFVPSHTIPLVHPKNTVVTIHDFGFEYSPELYEQKPLGPDSKLAKFFLNLGARTISLGKFGNSELDYHRWAMKYAVKHASHFISVSQFTKDDAVKLFHANPKKIAVIYHGFDKKRFRPINQSPYKIPSIKLTNHLKPYIFFIGRIEKKKNMMRILQSFVRFKKRDTLHYKLVLAGMPGLGYDEIKTYIQKQTPDIQDSIIQLGYVSDEQLPYYLQNADIFLFPTLFEGFGIPVIEAFACGVPVICSNTTSLPEVADQAALLVDPKNIIDISNAINRLSTDHKLRKTLIQKGIKRSTDFSWEKAARETLDVLINS